MSFENKGVILKTALSLSPEKETLILYLVIFLIIISVLAFSQILFSVKSTLESHIEIQNNPLHYLYLVYLQFS